ncbi:MAG TPA: dockerin type I domain-containing protein [Fimbriimonadaceae bacterium]|nr:dockerin type I domain-containing protein [Fimbriimonadaceae bacterium]
MALRVRFLSAIPFLAFSLAGAQSIRVCTWNVSEFTGTDRLTDIQTVLFASGPVGAMEPDIVIAQEIQSPSAASAFVGALNAIEPGQWAVTYGSLTGTDSTSDSAIFYKPGRVTLYDAPFKVAPAGGTSGQPRDSWRFDFTINGDANPNEVLAIYDSHMKAGSTSDDQSRRQIEAQHIRADSNALPSNFLFLFGADTNIQASTQTAYQTMVSAGTSTRGEFFDPISSPGTWNNNGSFRYIHTQDPIGEGGMDDRFDQILICSGLTGSTGTHYIGQYGTPYSTTTWNDPNQSYRCWGNDGTSFNTSLTVTGNQMVGPAIAQAIINAASPAGTTPGGHCPVFLDLHYDALIPISGHVALGNYSGAVAGLPVTVEIRPAGTTNDVAIQTPTLDALGNFSLQAVVPPGNYDIAVKASHWLKQKIENVNLGLSGASGLAYSLINGDINGDNVISLADFGTLKLAYGSTSSSSNWNPNADLNGDGSVGLADFGILKLNYGRSGDQ